MRPLELNIMWLDKETSELSKLLDNYEEKEKDTSLKPVTFYKIDAIFPSEKYGREITCIILNGDEYLVDLPYKALKDILDTHYYNQTN